MEVDKMKNLNLNDCAGQEKRQEYLQWEEYFMAMAVLAAQRSKDPVTQVGACLVNPENKIVAIGYNGMPQGCDDDEYPWAKNTPSAYDSKYLYVCHAEMNAIMNKNSADVKNCRMFVTHFPCNECAKIIIQSGVTSVTYLNEKGGQEPPALASKRMFTSAGIKYREYFPKNQQIILDMRKLNTQSAALNAA